MQCLAKTGVPGEGRRTFEWFVNANQSFDRNLEHFDMNEEREDAARRASHLVFMSGLPEPLSRVSGEASFLSPEGPFPGTTGAEECKA